MGKSAYSDTICRTCGKQISANGFSLASHNRLHVRQGLLTETRNVFNTSGKVYRSTEFKATPAAVVYRRRLLAERPCAFHRKDGKPCDQIATDRLTDETGHSLLACPNHRFSEHKDLTGPVNVVELESLAP